MRTGHLHLQLVAWLIILAFGTSCGTHKKTHASPPDAAQTPAFPPPASLCIQGGESSAAPSPSSFAFDGVIGQIFQQKCASCHGGATPVASLHLDAYQDPADASPPLEKWRKAASMIASGAMPPPGATSLHTDEKDAIAAWVAAGAPKTRADLGSPNACVDAAPRSLNRLSRAEYLNTLRDLFGPEVMAALTATTNQIPVEDRSGGFDNLTFSISEAHIRSYFQVANALREYFGAPGTITKILPCTDGKVVTDACFQQFIETFGLKAMRSPVSQDLAAELRASYLTGSTPTLSALLDVMTYFLMSPEFLYHLETGGAPVDGQSQVLALNDFEIASRLSYHILQSMPDDELFRAAENHELTTDEGIKKQAARLFTDPRAHETIKDFFTQWFQLDAPVETDFSPDFLKDAVIFSLKTDAQEELLTFLDHIIWSKKGTFADLFTSETSFLKTKALADIYGVVLPPQLPAEVLLPHDTRRGLLTRVAFLLQGNDETNPVKRGSFIRQKLLCEKIPPPDPRLLPPMSLVIPAPSPTQNTRQRWEEKTKAPLCQSCHGRMNPLGFSLERFDSIGRVRSQEETFNTTGHYVSSLALDTVTVPRIEAPGDAPVTGAIDLSNRMAVSEKAHACFIRQWFRFSEKRIETLSDEPALLSRGVEFTESGDDLQGLFTGTVLRPNFRTRQLSP